MAMIYIKARPGRAVFHDGKRISHDDFVPVPDSPYIRRLITHWDDVEIQGELPAVAPRVSGGSPTAPRPRTPYNE